MTRWKLWSGSLVGWQVRGIAVALVLIVLGLVLPAPDGNAAVGTKRWASATINFQKHGDWSAVPEEHQDALGWADNEWRNHSAWQPRITSSSRRNGIYWGEKPPGWSAERCNRPSETTDRTVYAIECTKLREKGSWEIVESDIVFNSTIAWTTAQVRGVATHELGHSAGLKHDPDPPGNPMCAQSDLHRWTMCAEWRPNNLAWASSIEQHDIDDVNSKY